MTQGDPSFLTLRRVLYVHDQSLAREGGIAGIGNPDGIESALGAVKNMYLYEKADVFAIAAAYAFHIAEAQAFLDGNKRTGAASAIVFLRLNGIKIPEDDGSIFKAMIGLANKQLDKAGLAVILRKLAGKTD
ncbi:MAG TPA: type II toxin-antitoxin system death-on-curing family toxin [Verrucomicrobiae bacterium]|jgi:death-on-curing protein|nr:type II toxin-antitoxin system death-on-curing family toxin [Verrucomicrobiae bacterium]